jgi:DNA topoisomerase IB
MPLPDDPSERMLAQLENDVVRQVASWLGNTPAVCRKAYIDPDVFRGWREGRLQRGAAGNARGPRQWERAALALLRRMHRS